MRVAAIDQGTTSTRCLVVADNGDWHLADTRRHGRHLPAPGWVEHDAEELLRNVQTVLEQTGPVDAIGLANQGESCLAWDAVNGKPLSPVIVWQDARTEDMLSQLGEEAIQLSKRICGLPLDPYFSASKLRWLLEHLPSVAAAHAAGRLRLGTTDAFFIDRLCGNFLTDLTTASRTGLLDMQRGCWSQELCDLHRVPMACLPRIVATDAGFGNIGAIPLRVSAVDQQAALYGHNCRNVGDAKITFGTGAFFLAVTGPAPPQSADLLPTVAWCKEGQAVIYALEGGVYDAGAALEWARSIGLYSALEELSIFEGPTAISRGMVFVPALSGLAAPYWDRKAAPLFIGMDHATDRRDMVRAVLEGIAMLTVSVVHAAAATTGQLMQISIDGGLSQSPYFAQFLASAANCPISVPCMHELSALGLAELCGLDVSTCRASSSSFYPDHTVTQQDHQYFAKALARAQAWRC